MPGGAKKFLSAPQARALLGTIRPRDLVGRTRRRLACELITELVRVDEKIKTANKELTALVEASGSGLKDLGGIGPSGAARLIGDIGDIHRFASRGHFASWNGTAPLDASCGDQQRHRLSRAGNRRINRVLHIMAVVQLRHDTEGRAYYRRKLPPARLHGSHALPQTPTVRCGLPANGRRRHKGEPGRAIGDDSDIQRGRPNPDGRLFG